MTARILLEEFNWHGRLMRVSVLPLAVLALLGLVSCHSAPAAPSAPQAAPSYRPTPAPTVTAEQPLSADALFKPAIGALTPWYNDVLALYGGSSVQAPEGEAALLGTWWALTDWCTQGQHGLAGSCYDFAATFVDEYFHRDPRTINSKTWFGAGAVGGLVGDSYDLTATKYLGLKASGLLDALMHGRPGVDILCQPNCAAVLGGTAGATLKLNALKVGKKGKDAGEAYVLHSLRTVPTVPASAGGVLSPQASGQFIDASIDFYNVGRRSVDIFCSFDLGSALVDTKGRQYDAIDSLYNVAGNTGCNEAIQPGFHAHESIVFQTPKGAKPRLFVLWDPNDGDDSFGEVSSAKWAIGSMVLPTPVAQPSGSLWGVYLETGGGTHTLDEVDRAYKQMTDMGLTPNTGLVKVDLTCDQGAAAALNTQDTTAVSVYFTWRADAGAFAASIYPVPVGIAHIMRTCPA